MSKKSIAVIFIVVFPLLLSFTSLNMVDVQADIPERKVGVALDDWGLYGDFEITWSSNDPNAKPDQALIDANRTAWIKTSVYNTTSTSLLFHETIHFTNETEERNARYVDIDNGWGDGVLFFISVGLKAGDSIYSSEEAALLKINKTISCTYVGVIRETNILNLTREDVVGGNQVIETDTCLYWDKATGIMTERWSTVVNKTGIYTTTWTRSDRIVETNLWGTPDTHRPVANAGLNQTVYANVKVTFDASRSTDNVGIVSYTWTFTDGTLKTLSDVNPTYTFTYVGVYEVTLNVTDAAELWDTDNVTITVIEDTISPVAKAGPDQTVTEDTPVSFDGSGSSDNVGIVSYNWDFGDGFEGSGPTATHTYEQIGEYTVTLTVKDAGGNSHTDTAIVTVESATEPPYLMIGVIVASFAVIGGLILWLRKK